MMELREQAAKAVFDLGLLLDRDECEAAADVAMAVVLEAIDIGDLADVVHDAYDGSPAEIALAVHKHLSTFLQPQGGAKQ